MDTIGFIGVGNMGSAILKGIAGSSLKQETSLFAYNPVSYTHLTLPTICSV